MHAVVMFFGAVYENIGGNLIETLEEGYYSLEEINDFLVSLEQRICVYQ